jgi:hypothetical protein
MIQYADFGHYSTLGWCPNVQLYIKYKTQHTSFGQPSETVPLSNSYNSLVFNTLPQNKKILPPQQYGDNLLIISGVSLFCFRNSDKIRNRDSFRAVPMVVELWHYTY